LFRLARTSAGFAESSLASKSEAADAFMFGFLSEASRSDARSRQARDGF
jgi:hypothetical protein